MPKHTMSEKLKNKKKKATKKKAKKPLFGGKKAKPFKKK